MTADLQPRGALLFSGGSDSSLAAIRTGERFEHVELLTMTRRGLSGVDNVQAHVERLNRYFGKTDKFRLHTFKTDELLKFLLYEHYISRVMQYGSLVLSHCGLCKLSFHWRALHFCLDEKIPYLADGAVRTAHLYPEQNEVIMLGPLRRFYGAFGVTYENPIYEEGETVEQVLYDLRYARAPKVKGTKLDHQMTCQQQVLYAMFMRHTQPHVDFQAWENRMAPFYADKIGLMTRLSREYVDQASGALAILIEKEEPTNVATSVV
jgi:hypothetical protein